MDAGFDRRPPVGDGLYGDAPRLWLLFDGDSASRWGMADRGVLVARSAIHPRGGAVVPADSGDWAGNNRGDWAAVLRSPPPVASPTPLDRHPDPRGHRPGHRLSDDRQTGSQRVTTHHRRSDCPRPHLSPAHTRPSAIARRASYLIAGDDGSEYSYRDNTIAP